MNVLVVEDDRKTAGFLNKGLTENGFEVEVASTGEEAIELVLAREFDVVILDILIPAPDGWSVLKRMRKNGRNTPVLFLTALDSVEERVRGLELGADDYLVKPFAFSELLARLHSILRRSHPDPDSNIRVADLDLDLVRRRAHRAGKELSLTPKEFVLLVFFAQRAGKPLSRSTIGKEVWGMHGDPDSNVVDVHIRRLRAKVDEPFPQSLIHTVRGLGYMFEDRN